MKDSTPLAAAHRPHGRMRTIIQPVDEQPHWCFPLVDPQWVPGAGADHMRDDDPVLGLEFNGNAWALPWWIMKNHHIANLTLDGRPILVTLCEVCSSAGAFDPVIDGRPHTFRLGGIHNGTIMPTDYETETLWTGFSGEAIEGPMAGCVMERLPLLQCTWREWLELYPQTLVPDGAGESRVGHGEGRAPGSPYVSEDMSALMSNVDRRLPHYELVLGVLVGNKSRCYPLYVLDQAGPVFNDTLGGEDIVIISRPGSWMASAYRRQLDGRALTFRSENGAVVDEQTGSRWRISGLAESGPLQGRQLEYVHSGIEEFFLWAAYNPDTDIHGLASGSSGGQVGGGPLINAFPKAVYQVIRRKWFEKGMQVLDAGCGDGMIAGLMAELGLNVYAVDADEERVRRARRSFRAVENLEFAAADLRRPLTLPRRFDAIVDHGLLSGLAREDHAAFAANLAAAAAPGARFLLLLPVTAESRQRRIDALHRLFEPDFRLLDTRQTTMPDPVSGKATGAVAVRLVRAS
jgi:SAM-dependent methyltransferase